MEIIHEIIIGLIVTSICSIIIIIYRNRRNFKFLKTLKIVKRLKEIGVTNFYYNRSLSLDDLGTTGNFINQATNEIYYVGCWLSISVEGQDISKRLYDIVMKDVSVFLCIISPNNTSIEAIADYFNESVESLRTKIFQVLKKLIEIKSNLPADKKNKFSIFVHNTIITTSYWAIDPQINNRTIFKLDHKSIHGLRYNSYGFVFSKTKKKEFADALWQSYSSVLRTSKEIISINDLT